MASIKDVAAEAGVSVATVSRVINNLGTVAEPTKKAVLNAVEKLGYKPNLFGRSLRSSQTKIIMVMLSSLANTFCASVIRSIDKTAGEHGYYTLVCTTDADPEKERYYTNFASNGFFDGMIILNSALTPQRMSELSSALPTVQCNEYIDSEHTPYVSIDNARAAYDAVKLLISNGRRKIVFYTADNNFVSTRERARGYRSALRDGGIEFDERLVLYGNYGYKNAMRGFDEFLNCGTDFDAVFAISDRMAAGAAASMLKTGIRIPEDVEIIGFDNTDISYSFTPQLTTVSQPHALLGKFAFEQLERAMKKQKTANVVLPHKIIERDSTKSRTTG